MNLRNCVNLKHGKKERLKYKKKKKWLNEKGSAMQQTNPSCGRKV